MHQYTANPAVRISFMRSSAVSASWKTSPSEFFRSEKATPTLSEIGASPSGFSSSSCLMCSIEQGDKSPCSIRQRRYPSRKQACPMMGGRQEPWSASELAPRLLARRLHKKRSRQLLSQSFRRRLFYLAPGRYAVSSDIPYSHVV